MLASRIDATLTAEGHEVQLATSVSEAPELEAADLLIADLDTEPPEAVVALGIPVLGFHRHTNVEVREQAEAAGVDLVVPRSRLAREMPELVNRLLADPAP
jgi:hypothetical protein